MTLAETRPFLQPFLNRAVPRPKWTKIWVFEGQKRLKGHLQRRTRWSPHHPHPSARRARRDNGKGTPFVRAGTLENSKNTEFATFLEMGLCEAYLGRALAVLAYGALEDTHTKHPGALGPTRRWAFRRTGQWRGTQGPGSSHFAPVVPYRVPPKFRY